MLTSATNVPRRENQTSSRIFLPSYTIEHDMLRSEMTMLGNLMTGQFQILVEPIIIFQSDAYVFYLNDD